MHKFFILATCWVFPLLSFGQYFSQFYDIDGLNDSGWGLAVTDKEIRVHGAAICNYIIQAEECHALLRIDHTGKLLSTTIIDSIIVGTFNGIYQTDGKIITSGMDFYFSESDSTRLKLFEFDELGTLQRTYSYGLPDRSSSHLGGLTPTSYGFIANNWYNDDDDVQQHWMVAFDDSLNVLWENTFSDGWDTANPWDLTVSDDGRYLYAGYQGENQCCEGEAFLVQFDSLGNERWIRYFGYKKSYTIVEVVAMQDGNVAAAWWTPHFPDLLIFGDSPMIFVYDSLGNKVWEYPFYEYQARRLYHLTRAANGDLIGAGWTTTGDPPFPEAELEELFGIDLIYGLSEETLPCRQGWIFRMSPQGELKWQRTIRDVRVSPLVDPCQYFLRAAELPNGDLVFAGQSRTDTVGPGVPSDDVWLVRTDSAGCLTPDCGMLQVIEEDTIVNVNPVDTFTLVSLRPEPAASRRPVYRAFPNPAGAMVQVAALPGEDAHRVLEATVYDALGRVISRQAGLRAPFQLESAAWAPGLYLLELRSPADGYRQVLRVVKE